MNKLWITRILGHVKDEDSTYCIGCASREQGPKCSFVVSTPICPRCGVYDHAFLDKALTEHSLLKIQSEPDSCSKNSHRIDVLE